LPKVGPYIYDISRLRVNVLIFLWCLNTYAVKKDLIPGIEVGRLKSL
jgi:hypothetical protein